MSLITFPFMVMAIGGYLVAELIKALHAAYVKHKARIRQERIQEEVRRWADKHVKPL